MRRTAPLMGTLVTVHVVPSVQSDSDGEEAIDRAFEWFRRVEAACSRFDPASELMSLQGRVGEPVEVSEMLFAAVEMAMAVAVESGGAFDPTVGRAMEMRGFDRHYANGRVVQTPGTSAAGSYRDVELDAGARTVTLHAPLVLDLGAVAKGLAVDLAARELQPFRNFAIDAGGDLYLSGRSERGDRWRVGIRHPRADDRLIATLDASDCAVCTSGDYERRDVNAAAPHILDPRAGAGATSTASATVVATSAMLADALGTAAFVLGGREGLAFLDRHGVNGLLVSTSLDTYATAGMSDAFNLLMAERSEPGAADVAILPHA